jgi:hypothetical protein
MAIADQPDDGYARGYRATHRLVSSSLAGGHFFGIWKSGCKVEALQLGTRERLERALVIYLIIAWRASIIIPARRRSRHHSDHMPIASATLGSKQAHPRTALSRRRSQHCVLRIGHAGLKCGASR